MRLHRLRGRPGPPVRLDAPIVNGRVPRHDLDAEAAVLSAVLLSHEAFDRVIEILKPEHFYSDANGRIFEAAIALSLSNPPIPIDIVTIGSWLRDREKLAQIGGATYLAQLADATPAVAHVEDHARVVRELARLRELVATCQRVAAEGYGDVGVVQEFIDSAEQSIYEIAHETGENQVHDVSSLLKDEFRRFQEALERGERMAGVPTGFERLDWKMSGLCNDDLTIVAARPGMGKTSLMMNIGVNVAAPRETEENCAAPPICGVMIFSMEMSKEQLTARLVCSESRTDFGKYRNRMLQPADWARIEPAAKFLGSLPLFIDDTPGMDLLTARAKIRRKKAEFDRPAKDGKPEQRIGLVCFDYVQLMKAPDHIENREQQVSHNARGLKNLVKELGIHGIALSQLNRLTETRSTKDHRPQISDLRESGELEQAADNILLLYRDEFYNPETTDAKGIAELIIGKQRNGPTGKVLTRFTASCTRFDNLASGDYPETNE